MKRRQYSPAKTEEKSGLPLFYKRLLTLWDMQPYVTEQLVHIIARVDYVKENIAYYKNIKGGWSDARRTQCQTILREASPWLEKLGLDTSKGFLDDLARDMPRLSDEVVKEQADLIKRTLEKELKNRKFFVLNQEYARYYNNPLLAGDRFKDNWPKANAELTEAGNCLAFERHTACVCHVMRALEFVFQSLENKLLVPPQTNPALKTWGRMLERIVEKKGEPGKGKQPAIPPSREWAKDPDFYNECCFFLSSVKSAYRDKAFHVESVYDAPGAKAVFDASVVAIQHMAKKLDETK